MKRLKTLFQRKQKPKTKTESPARHTDSENQIELAFEIDGEAFYRFKNLTYLTSHARFFAVGEYLQCVEYRVTPELREHFFEMVDAYAMRLAQQDARHQREKLARELMAAAQQYVSRAERLPDTEILIEVAARVFFKLEDDLAELPDNDELERRKTLLKKKGVASLLIEQPLMSMFGLANLSSEHFPKLESGIIASTAHSQALKKAIKKSLEKGG